MKNETSHTCLRKAKMANQDSAAAPHLQLSRFADDLLKYTYDIVQKFPKAERFALTESIKKRTDEAVYFSVCIASYFDRHNREELLRRMYVEIKTLERYVKVAYDCKYITPQNYEAWTKKLVNIGNILVGWLRKIEAGKSKTDYEKPA